MFATITPLSINILECIIKSYFFLITVDGENNFVLTPELKAKLELEQPRSFGVTRRKADGDLWSEEFAGKAGLFAALSNEPRGEPAEKRSTG